MLNFYRFFENQKVVDALSFWSDAEKKIVSWKDDGRYVDKNNHYFENEGRFVILAVLINLSFLAIKSSDLVFYSYSCVQLNYNYIFDAFFGFSFLPIFVIIIIILQWYFLKFTLKNENKTLDFFVKKSKFNFFSLYSENYISKNAIYMLSLTLALFGMFRIFCFDIPYAIYQKFSKLFVISSKPNFINMDIYYETLDKLVGLYTNTWADVGYVGTMPIIQKYFWQYNSNGERFDIYIQQCDLTNIAVIDHLAQGPFGLVFLYDGYTFVLLFLTCLIFSICFFTTKPYLSTFFRDTLLYFIVFISLVIAFTTQNILLFYFVFELTVLPMYFLINLGGVSSKKVKAGYYFIGYTMLGSLALLVAILGLFIIYPSLLYGGIGKYIIMNNLSLDDAKYFCFLFLFGFAVKIPLFPVFNWLPEAHVEAPTLGSVILAALLLKLGIYGIFRFCIGWFPEAFNTMSAYVEICCIFGFLVSSMSALTETDMKRIIAYSSIAHMNLTVLGFCANTVESIIGALYYSFTHGLVSAGLFYLVGTIYDRTGKRDVDNYGGISSQVPMFTFYFFLFNLANLGFPLTAPFVSELAIFIGLWERHPLIFIWLIFGFLLTLGYTMLLFTRVCLGVSRFDSALNIPDLTRDELSVFSILIILIFVAGVFPSPILAILSSSLF